MPKWTQDRHDRAKETVTIVERTFPDDLGLKPDAWLATLRDALAEIERLKAENASLVAMGDCTNCGIPFFYDDLYTCPACGQERLCHACLTHSHKCVDVRDDDE